MAEVLELLTLLTARCFCVVQKQKGVADAMIEARSAKQTIKRLARQVEDLDDNAAIPAHALQALYDL